MKKIYQLFPILALLFAISSCTHEEDDIFDKSAAERLNEISNIYSQRLSASKGGWVMEYYPYNDNENLVTGVGYLIMTRFHENKSVFTGMKNAATEIWTSIPENSNYEIWKKVSTSPVYMSDSSSWEVITDMGPVLTFNTYNKCFGRFTDPSDIEMTPSKYDDESGNGFEGDYEFVMVDVPEGGNHIMLKGKKRGLYHRMSRVPEGTDFEAYLDDIENYKKEYFSPSSIWELTMTDNGIAYKMNHMSRTCPRVYPDGKDSVAYGWLMPYLVTKYDGKYHLRFKDTLMVNGKQMEQEFYYDQDKDEFLGMTNASNKIVSPEPTAFMIKSMKENHLWYFDLNSEMDGVIATNLQTVAAEFASMNYNLVQANFSIMDDFRVKLNLKSKKSSVELTYLYDMEETAEGLRVKYREPFVSSSSKASEVILSTITSLKPLLESFNGTYTAASATGTNFNLLKMRISNATNGSIIMSVK